MNNRIETEDDRSVQVAAVHGRQDMRMKRHSMGVPKESHMKGRGLEECPKCGRSHRPRKCPSI